MRKLFPLSTVLILLPLAGGCHQAPATTGTAPLSPVGAGQAPTLNPFASGPTKVTPPPTGSYSAPNTYMGSPVPAGTVSPGQVSPMPGGPYPTQSNNAIGTGAQGGGWTSGGQVVTQTSPPVSGVAPVSTFGTTTTDPRSGGMQVIDMTSAPAPPGYRPAGTETNISVPPPRPPVNYPPAAAPTQTYPTPTYPATTYPTPTYPTTNGQNVGAPMASSSSANVASLTPMPSNGSGAIPIQSPAIQPVGTQPQGTVGGPSTDPVGTPGSTDPNVIWRAPGSQF